ncbi:type II toxin-antitoxin system YafQ family toxin [Alloscardovia macacae]|uniref:RelE/StbE family addiction module toxin n=1 Tax=Alloscardovia macacae TaxID=1160091 RepID=A0A261F5C3_9BIFI|nr:type II toxin-antitoxin system YafQ family toxin [Alloscardovia macacae]OZG54349.1 RelE/StbE family addiction module toxin [Alloscardovia macacae]
MRYKVKFSSTFKKSYKRIKRRGLDVELLDTIIGKLAAGEALDARYRDHALGGNFAGFRECHVRPNWLLMYYIEDDILTLTCVDTGSHSDLFKM